MSVNGSSFYVKHISKGEGPDLFEYLPPHIDDNFLFIINEDGFGSMDVDFNTIAGDKPSLIYVNPGEVHGNIHVKDADFWCVKISPEIVHADYVSKMFSLPTITRPVLMDKILYDNLLRTLHILSDYDKFNDPVYNDIKNNTISLFFSIIIRAISDSPESSHVSVTIPDKKLMRDFTELLEKNFKTEKSIQFYTNSLNISSSYLSEVTRLYTGKSMQQLLIDRIVLEAQRMLIYTDLTVKQISYELGYDDPSYFSRLLKAKTGKSPLSIRRDYDLGAIKP